MYGQQIKRDNDVHSPMCIPHWTECVRYAICTANGWADLCHKIKTEPTSCGGSRTSDSFLSRSEGLEHAEGPPTRFMDASGGVLSEGYGHGGTGVCLGDGQTEAEGVPSQGGRGDALLRRMYT